MNTIKTIYIKNKDTFKQIINSSKTIEIRKKSKFVETINVNDVIIFFNENKSVKVKITKILISHSLKSLGIIINELNNINSNISTIDELINHYSKYYKNINTSFYALYYDFLEKNIYIFIKS